jgi:GNAT superfamily N-acetyltransferase
MMAIQPTTARLKYRTDFVQRMVEYFTNRAIKNEQLNELFASSWDGWEDRDFHPLLSRSLGHVFAADGDRLIGFVNVAWDGGWHAFLLDTTVHPDYRRQRIGTALVKRAIQIARDAGTSWIHVDFEDRLSTFYLERCGFVPTSAGLVRLK